MSYLENEVIIILVFESTFLTQHITIVVLRPTRKVIKHEIVFKKKELFTKQTQNQNGHFDFSPMI